MLRSASLFRLGLCLLLFSSGAGWASEPPAAPASPARFDGLWKGALVYHPEQVEADLTLEITTDPTTGTLDVPLLSLRYVALRDLQLDGRSISFSVKPPSAPDAGGGVYHFQGSLAADGRTITGTFSGHVSGLDLKLPFEAERKGEAGSGPPPAKQRPLTVLGDDGQALRSAFNRDRGKVRLVMLLSPTCLSCLGAAEVVERYVLDQIPDDGLRVYTIWGTILGDETQERAAQATIHLPDPRVTHFWTGGQALADRIGKASGLRKGAPGWDTFLLFAPGVTWGDTPPTPDSLMYIDQNFPNQEPMNGKELARKVRELLQGRQHP